MRTVCFTISDVIPAKAGIHGLTVGPWIPDQAGDDIVLILDDDIALILKVYLQK